MSASVQTQGEPELSDDFLTYLEGRFGLDEHAVVSTLSSWMASYEPGPLALARARSPLMSGRRALP